MYRINGLICTTVLLLSATQPLQAATVFRCEDNSGQVTFTLQGCPVDQSLVTQQAENLTPSSGAPVAMAAKARRTSNSAITKTKEKTKTKPKRKKELVVVAEQQDGCGNRVIGTQRRTAIIRKQVQAGMTQADIESSLGKPDAQTSLNGDTQYIYKADNGSGRKVTFDQNGCVKSKR